MWFLALRRFYDTYRTQIWLTLFVLAMFFWLRLVHLPSTLYFFNDMGRDLLVVWQSWQNKKPFLLGPQNSAIPFNQPALYFYLLFPAALLTNFSLYTHTISFLFFLFGVITLLVALAWRNKATWLVILAVLWLIAIQPQFITQNRFIWNPSFVPYCLLLSCFAYLKLRQNWDKRLVWLWATSSAAALAFSYSVIPFALAFFLLLVWHFRLRSWRLLLPFLTTTALFHALTFVFELRYKFQLTRAVLFGERLPQPGSVLSQKLLDLARYFWSTDNLTLIIIFTLVFLASIALNYKFARKNNTHWRVFIFGLQLSILTLIWSIVIPISVQAHYVFPFFLSVFLIIAGMQPKLSLTIMAFLTWWWLRPAQLSYLSPPPRTLAQTQECARQVCQIVKQPVFVSVTSDLHPYHNGPEWRFLFAKHGCQTQEIELPSPTAATSHMLVVADQGKFDPVTAAYYELSLFGQYQVSQTLTCPGNVEVHVLQR